MSAAAPATRDWLVAAIAKLGSIEPERVTDAACLNRHDLNVDSIDRVALSLDAEDAFSIELDDCDLGAGITVAETVALIDARRGA